MLKSWTLYLSFWHLKSHTIFSIQITLFLTKLLFSMLPILHSNYPCFFINSIKQNYCVSTMCNAALSVWNTKLNKKVNEKLNKKQNSVINYPTSTVPFPISYLDSDPFPSKKQTKNSTLQPKLLSNFTGSDYFQYKIQVSSHEYIVFLRTQSLFMSPFPFTYILCLLIENL